MDAGNQQNHPGNGAGEEAEGEHHHDGGHQEHRSLQLRPVAHGLFPEPVDDVHGAVDQDDEGDEDLGEEDHLSQTVRHILNQYIFWSIFWVFAMAVAAIKVFEHGGDGERQKKQPDEDRDMRRFLESS